MNKPMDHAHLESSLWSFSLSLLYHSPSPIAQKMLAFFLLPKISWHFLNIYLFGGEGAKVCLWGSDNNLDEPIPCFQDLT